MSSFEAQGLTFTKSSWSETDWTQQCVGVRTMPYSLAGPGSALADSVTGNIVSSLPNGELLALLHTVK